MFYKNSRIAHDLTAFQAHKEGMIEALFSLVEEIRSRFRPNQEIKEPPKPCVVEFEDGYRAAGFEMFYSGQGLSITEESIKLGFVIVDHPEHKSRHCNEFHLCAGNEKFHIKLTPEGIRTTSLTNGNIFYQRIEDGDHLNLEVGKYFMLPCGSKKISFIMPIDATRHLPDSGYGGTNVWPLSGNGWPAR